ncbi:M1 family metallopeptidase [Bacteroidota bacterium]
MNNRFIRITVSILLTVFTHPSAFTQPFDPPLSDRIANYDIKVELDTKGKILKGEEKLTWINPSEDTLNSLQFHMYLNAFKNTLSTFMEESGGRVRGLRMNEKDIINYGWIQIDQLTTSSGDNLTGRTRYISPDDGNLQDQTVLEIDLIRELLPHDTLVLNIEFTAKLPKIFARTGFSKNYYLVGQWFPKIGVYEIPGQRYAETGQWNCHQFHSNSEFYADFGVYNVDITVPEEYIVGASGWLVNESQPAGSTKTLSYRAEDVIDFVWTASPDYVVTNDEWEHVSITLLNQPEHAGTTERYITSAKQGLEYYGKHLGKYPYKTLTIVDPPLHAIGAGGMEYPTFITLMTTYMMPVGLRYPEVATIHELGHEYFMLLLATNEFEEPFLDEGFNTYFEQRAMDHYYGKKSSMVEIGDYQIGDTEIARRSFTGMSHPKIGKSSFTTWEFKHGGGNNIIFFKTAIWLKTLEGLVGIEVMDEIMKTYFDRWKFKHPCGQDFIDIVNEVVPKYHAEKLGPDMDWFFDQVHYGDDICDYKLSNIQNEEVKIPYGILDVFRGNQDKEESLTEYNSKVIVHRLGEIKMPVEVLVHFDDGTEKLESWNGKDRSFEYIYTGQRKVVWAHVDPEKKIYIDSNFINNSRTVEPERAVIWKYTFKILFWIQNIMQSFVLFI